MMTRPELIGQGIALGLGAAAPIGPVNVEIARRALSTGFLAGFTLGCGAVSVDLIYAVLSSLSVGPLLQHPAVRWAVTVGGVILLIYLSGLCFRGAVRALRADPLSAAARAGIRRAYLTGVLMTLLNPMTLAFWFLVVPGQVGAIGKEPARELPMICVGIFIGTLGWVVAFAGILGWAARWRRNWWSAVADAIGGLILLAFAAAQVWRAVAPLL